MPLIAIGHELCTHGQLLWLHPATRLLELDEEARLAAAAHLGNLKVGPPLGVPEQLLQVPCKLALLVIAVVLGSSLAMAGYTRPFLVERSDAGAMQVRLVHRRVGVQGEGVLVVVDRPAPAGHALRHPLRPLGA